MIDRILARFGLLRKSNVVDGLLYVREIERVLQQPIGDRHMANAMAIASGLKPAPHPNEDRLVTKHRLRQAALSAEARRVMGR